jgi:CheY-like chemotaxis protein
MVHGLTEQFGGRLTLQSRPGEGTTAALWLPVADARPQAIDQIQRSAGETPKDQGSLVIVAVDDDGLVLTNTIAMLDDLGHTGLAASSGREALDILRRGDAVDLVITDQLMPQMTGLQLAEAIKREWPDLPVILATGYAEIAPGTEVDLPKLSKPFTQAELAAELARTALRGRKAGRVLKFRAGTNSPA